jgi:hypothetical protein
VSEAVTTTAVAVSALLVCRTRVAVTALAVADIALLTCLTREAVAATALAVTALFTLLARIAVMTTAVASSSCAVTAAALLGALGRKVTAGPGPGRLKPPGIG